MMKNIPRVGLGVLILNETNQILLGQRIGAHGNETWAPPGGHLEFGETFEAAAIREVYEETGLIVADPQLMGVTNDVFETENKHYVSIFMKVVFPENQIIQNCEPHKTKEWKWFSLDNLPQPLFLPLQQLINFTENF